MYGPISCSGVRRPAPFIFLFTSKTLYKDFLPFFTCRKKKFHRGKKKFFHRPKGTQNFYQTFVLMRTIYKYN